MGDGISAGAFLRCARALSGLTLGQLAHDAHISQTYLSMIERGERRLTTDVADRVRRALVARVGR